MGQSARQQARRRVMQEHARRRREREVAERRCSSLGVDVAVALEERDAPVGRYEMAAGCALMKLTRDEGVNVAEDHLGGEYSNLTTVLGQQVGAAFVCHFRVGHHSVS